MTTNQTSAEVEAFLDASPHARKAEIVRLRVIVLADADDTERRTADIVSLVEAWVAATTDG